MMRLNYLLALAGCTALGLLFAEYVVLPRLEKSAAVPGAAQLSSAAWVRDNELINRNVSHFKDLITKDDWKSHLNLKIKFREGFRPFAPMVLAEAAADWFDVRQSGPSMLFASPVLEKHRLSVLLPKPSAHDGCSALNWIKIHHEIRLSAST